MDCVDIPQISGLQVPWMADGKHRPVSASLELTQRCNNRCIHCYLDPANRRAPADLPTEFWLQMLDVLQAEECLFVTFTGGEPLLRADFSTLYKAAKGSGFVPTIMTNARLISDEIVALLADLPPRCVSVSLYGASAATYDHVSAVPGSFHEAIAGIRRLHDGGIPFHLKTMLLQSNYHELGQMKSLADELGCTLRFDCSIMPTVEGGRHVQREQLAPETIVDIEFADPEVSAKLRETYQASATIQPCRTAFLCNAGRWNVYVDATGAVLPCSSARRARWPLDRRELGPSFHRAFHEEMPKVTLRPISGSFACGECELRLLCPACTAFRDLETGSLTQPSEFGCKVARLRALRAAER